MSKSMDMKAMNRKVLLVDDIQEYVDTMALNLPSGCQAVSANSVADAKNLLTKEHLDLAILDIRLNSLDAENREGLELLKWIKENYQEIPVIIISGYKEFEFELDALSLGAECFLRKPVQPDEFQETVRQVLEREHLRK